MSNRWYRELIAANKQKREYLRGLEWWLSDVKHGRIPTHEDERATFWDEVFWLGYRDRLLHGDARLYQTIIQDAASINALTAQPAPLTDLEHAEATYREKRLHYEVMEAASRMVLGHGTGEDAGLLSQAIGKTFEDMKAAKLAYEQACAQRKEAA